MPGNGIARRQLSPTEIYWRAGWLTSSKTKVVPKVVHCTNTESRVNSGLAKNSKRKFWSKRRLYETSGFAALCRSGLSGNGLPEGGANVCTGNSARGLAYVRRDDERRSPETFRSDSDLDTSGARQSNTLPEDTCE